MAYAQWIQIDIKSLNFNGKIDNAKLMWGKFYEKGNKDKELKVSEINGQAINSGETYSVYSCGRSDSASGTEGEFFVYDGNVKIAKLYWDCPWGNKTNTFLHEKYTGDDYMIEISDYNHYGGALGSYCKNR